MKLDTFISHLRSILLKEGNLEVTHFPLSGMEESLEDRDILCYYDTLGSRSVDIYISNLHLTK